MIGFRAFTDNDYQVYNLLDFLNDVDGFEVATTDNHGTWMLWFRDKESATNAQWMLELNGAKGVEHGEVVQTEGSGGDPELSGGYSQGVDGGDAERDQRGEREAPAADGSGERHRELAEESPGHDEGGDPDA